MNDQSKTKTQLIDELEQTRNRVAELEQVEEALRESEEKYRTIFDNVSDSITYVNKYGTIISANNKEEIFGRTPEEIVGKKFTKLGYFDAKEIPKYLRLLKDIITGRQTLNQIELEIKHKDGHKIPVEVSNSLVKKNGKIEGFVCMVRDITKRKQAEKDLRESEEKYRTIFENVSDSITYINKYGTIISANDKEEIFGRKPEEITGKRFTELGYFDVKDIPKYLKLLKDVITGKKTPTLMELEVMHKDGHKFPVEMSTSLVKRDGKTVGFVCITRDITERRQAEEAIKASEERYRSLVESTDDALYLIGRDMRYEFANGKYLSRLGLSLVELIGQEYGKLHPSDTSEEFAKKVDQVIKSGKSMVYEHLSHRDNQYFLRTLSPVIDPSTGRPTAITVISKNITERKQAEEELRNRTYDLGERVKELNCLYCISKVIETPDATIDEIFQGTVDLIPLAWEYPEIACARIILDGQEFRTKNWQESEWRQTSDIEVGHERTGTVEVYYLEEKPESDEGPFLKEEQSLLNRVAEHLGSIIERKRAEEELRQSEEKYRQLFATVSDAIVMFDANTRQFLDVNAKAIELYGYTREEFLQMKQLDISAEPEASELSIKETLAGYRVHVSLQYHKKKDGTVFPVEISRGVYTFGERKVICGVIRDITETKLAEKALRESEEKYRQLVELSPDSIAIHQEGKIVFINTAGARQLGAADPEQLIGKPIMDFLHPDYHDIVKERVQRINKEKEEAPLMEEKIIRLDGTVIDVNVTVVTSNYKGKPAVQAIARDITERKQAQDELRESREQLRSLSAHLQTVREESQKLLAREIHDELGQDLTALKMDLSWMKGKLRQDQELLREKAAAMTKLADAMIKTVKKITARLRPALLDDLGVAAALEWELGEFAERTGIGCNLTVEPEEIDLDPDRSTAVYRIFQEALTNIARHSQATSVEAALRVDSGRLEMEISDNGAGITKVQIASPRSFGLIGIRERAMQFGGEVRIEGVKGKGTTISITLPLDDGGDHHD